MKVFTGNTKEVDEQYDKLIKRTIKAIEVYQQDKDRSKFNDTIFGVIDDMPNTDYLDPDICAMFDLKVDDMTYVECTEDEMALYKENTKSIIKSYDELYDYQLSLKSSGSILYTIFGSMYNKK